MNPCEGYASNRSKSKGAPKSQPLFFPFFRCKSELFHRLKASIRKFWEYSLLLVNPCGGSFKTIKKQGCSEFANSLFCCLIDFSVDWDYALNAWTLLGGSFKKIKKQGCSEFATSLICCLIDFSVDWDYALNAWTLVGGSFKTIKKQGCSEFATSLFCFFPMQKRAFSPF